VIHEPVLEISCGQKSAHRHTDTQTDTPMTTRPCGLRRAGKYHAIKHRQNTINQDNQTLFGLGFMEMIPSPRLGFLRGIFLDNHLASNDNTRTT